jgi:DNA invertase Pin-like site-specific DNA recombinase
MPPGTSLSVLLDTHRVLEGPMLAMRSATDPFDTGTAVGKLLFQVLGSFAELEKKSMPERLALGGDRVANVGKWTGWPDARCTSNLSMRAWQSCATVARRTAVGANKP